MVSINHGQVNTRTQEEVKGEGEDETQGEAQGQAGPQRTTGAGTPMVVRMHKPQMVILDQWIEKQGEPKVTRPEAIRRLVMQALTPEAEPVERPAALAPEITTPEAAGEGIRVVRRARRAMFGA